MAKDIMEFDANQVSFFNARVSDQHSDEVVQSAPATISAQAIDSYQTDITVNGVGDWNKALASFLDINNWGKTTDSSLNANFQLTDASGKNKNGLPKVGDLIRIDISDPSGDKDRYDWVKIENISQSPNELHICLRPYDKDGNSSADHFFSNKTSITFTLTLAGDKQLQFCVNNGSGERAYSDVATAGKNAIFYQWGLQKGQWKNLGAGIMNAAQ